MKRVLLGLSLILSSSFLQAGVLEFTGVPSRSVSASGQEIPIYKEATFHMPNNPLDGTKLYLTGAGLRTKKFVIVKANVYVASSYTDNSEALGENPMAGIEKAKLKVLQLTFLRDVSAEKIRHSFQEALRANGIDTQSVSLQGIWSALSFDAKEKQTLTMVGAGDTVSFVFPEKTLTAEGKNLANQFWKIWFGKPCDGGMETLKADLVAGK